MVAGARRERSYGPPYPEFQRRPAMYVEATELCSLEQSG